MEQERGVKYLVGGVIVYCTCTRPPPTLMPALTLGLSSPESQTGDPAFPSGLLFAFTFASFYYHRLNTERERTALPINRGCH